MTNLAQPTSRPYADGVQAYLDAGWLGVLPCDWPRANSAKVGVPPTGFTGGRQSANWGVYPDSTQLETWKLSRADANLGLRVPPNVIALDVDCYPDEKTGNPKNGCDELAWCEQNLGELPPTWYSTSRQDGSRKLLFRVDDYEPGEFKEPGNGLELLRHDHRWVRVWPSVNPKTGAPERWFTPDGSLSDRVPRVTELSRLESPEWLDYLRDRARVTRAEHRPTRTETSERESFDWSVFTGEVGSIGTDVAQNDLLFRALASLWGGSSEGLRAVAHLLGQHLRSDPDHPKGLWTPEAIDGVWRSVTRYEPGRSAVELPAGVERFVTRLRDAGSDVQLTDAQRRALEREEATRFARRLLDEAELADARGRRVVRSGREYARVEQPGVVLPDTLAAELNLLGGPNSAGKSLLARDWAFDVIERGGSALWVPSEGMHDFATRFESRPRFDACADRLLVLDDAVDLRYEVDWLLQEVQRVDLVVFDVIYGMGMTDDTGVKDVLPIVNALKRISAEWKCATLAIGHNGHNGERRFRGSSVWRQLAAVEWHLADGSLTCGKSKIANGPDLTRTYVVEYPELRWTSVSEHLSRASGRDEVIQRDFETCPDDSDSRRAARLAPILGVSERTARRLVASYREQGGAK